MMRVGCFRASIIARAMTVFPLPVGEQRVPKSRESIALTASVWKSLSVPVNLKSTSGRARR